MSGPVLPVPRKLTQQVVRCAQLQLRARTLACVRYVSQLVTRYALWLRPYLTKSDKYSSLNVLGDGIVTLVSLFWTSPIIC